MDWMVYGLTVLIGFLLGSIPTGYLVAKGKGIDIRSVGSGNIGATNAFRVLGKGPGIFVLLVDGLKGWTSARFAGKWALQILNSETMPSALWLMIVGGVAAIIGHNYTPWLRFKGGKGIATSAGVLLAWSPLALAVTLGVWLVVFLGTKYVSLASMVAALVLPVAIWIAEKSEALTLIATALSALAIFKHRANIQRLRNGTENKIQFRRGSGNPSDK